MIKLAVFFLLVSLAGNSQSVFPFENDKIIYRDSSLLFGTFSKQVKIALNKYANGFNGLIYQEPNKMKDYIVFEDSNSVYANVKFVINQTFVAALWIATIQVTKANDSAFYKLSDIKMDKMGIVGAGNLQGGQSLEDYYNSAKRKNVKFYSALNKQILSFMEELKNNVSNP